MTDYSLYEQIKNEIEPNLTFLEDKPDENIETTLRACWLAASGVPVSAQTSPVYDLPTLTEHQFHRLNQYLQQRTALVPLAHITGRQHFMDIEFLSDKRAMIPRKETEIITRKGLQLSRQLSVGQQTVEVMDVCCGSGNIGLSIGYHNPHARIFSSDISAEAVSLALDNAHFLGLSNRVLIRQGDLFEPFRTLDHSRKVDIVISNPPYISSGKVQKMNDEIKGYEPVPAFDGGKFGMDIIQRIILESSTYLRKDGWLLFEVGAGQGEFSIELCKRSEQFKNIQAIPDRQGVIRGVMAQKSDT